MLLKGALLALLTIAIYWPAMHADFVYDDAHFVIGNDLVRNGPISWKDPRSLTLATYRLNFLTTGDDPLYFHLTNLAIHLLNGLLVFVIAKSLLELDSTWALFMAGLFILHPLQSESVIYISGRSELLAALFILLSVLMFSRSWYVPAFIAFILAAMSKEIGLMTPALWWATVQFRSPKRELFPWAVVLAVGIALWLSPVRAYAETAVHNMNMAGFYAIASLLAKSILPTGFNIDHDFTGIAWTFGAVAALAWGGAFIAAMIYRRTLAGFAGLWIMALLFPHVLVEPVGYLAEHHFYSPMLGIAALLTLGIRYLSSLRLPIATEAH